MLWVCASDVVRETGGADSARVVTERRGWRSSTDRYSYFMYADSGHAHHLDALLKKYQLASVMRDGAATNRPSTALKFNVLAMSPAYMRTPTHCQTSRRVGHASTRAR